MESVRFSKQQLLTFIDTDTIRNFAENLIKHGRFDYDEDEIKVEVDIPKPITNSKLANNYEAYGELLTRFLGDYILLQINPSVIGKLRDKFIQELAEADNS